MLGYAEAQNEAVGPDASVYNAINRVRNRINLPEKVYTVIPAPGGGRKFYVNKNYLWPIPQSAMDRNKNLVQNPEY